MERTADVTAPGALHREVEELSLSPTPEALWACLERLARDLSGASGATWRAWDEEAGGLVSPGGERLDPEGPSPEARAALLRAPAAAEDRLCLPVTRFGRLLGVLSVEGAPPAAREPLQELAAAAALVARTVETEVRHAAWTRESLDLLVTALEAVHPELVGHTDRVVRLAGELARMLDLSADARERLWWAAQVHDLGMLRLQGRPAAERERLHPVAGADFLRAGEALRDVAPLVEGHHERHDGSGFPAGRSGDDLPLECWVLALAEDLEESRRAAPGADYDTWLRGFFERSAPAHHPAAVDALGGLADAGRLEPLFR